MRQKIAAIILLTLTSQLSAGLHYSGELINTLPSRWPGFIMDHRLLRNVARRPSDSIPASPLRQRYEQAAEKLQKLAEKRKLTAAEAADLGALQVRLGKLNEAISTLRVAQRQFPDDFRINANLATAWQMQDNLAFAAASLEQAIRHAPERWKKAESLHLKLIRMRQREKAGAQSLDDLFGIKFLNDKNEYQPGRLSQAAKKKLPTDAVALTQQLALWLPADGRLLWLLAELAAVHGNIRTSAAMMDGCVTELALRDRELRKRRLKMQNAAQELLKLGPTSKDDHAKHAIRLKTESVRPLANRFFQMALPEIKPDGINRLPWEVVTQTTVNRHYRPTFPKYLKELDGKQVSLQGYIQPLGNDLEMTSFLLIEYPVGCWYCEIPEIIAMIYVELALDKSVKFTRELINIQGTLKLNDDDPEDFLYSIRAATVRERAR